MTKELTKPIFIISLDTELLWGYVGYPSNEVISLMKSDAKKVRGCIDILLNLFQKHNIPATWAVVGHLFLDHCECESGIPHKEMPRFKEDWYSSDPCTDIKRDPLYYGKDIVEKILSRRIEHEIGYHSFSHVPFSECSREVAEAEIKEGVKLAKEFGITLKSFVFPENKIGHVDILKKYGFKIYRGYNLAGESVGKSLPVRTINFAQSKIVPFLVEPIPKFGGGIWGLPSSMMLPDPLFRFTLALRAGLGVRKAIRENKILHVFLHPHSLLMYPSLKDDLDKFLGIVAKKRNEGKIEVMTMGELASHLKSK